MSKNDYVSEHETSRHFTPPGIIMGIVGEMWINPRSLLKDSELRTKLRRVVMRWALGEGCDSGIRPRALTLFSSVRENAADDGGRSRESSGYRLYQILLRKQV